MIRELMQWLGLAEQPAQLDTIDLFLAGYSIPKLSSGAADIISRQREIEDEVRSYIGQQDRYIGQLEQQIAELTARQSRSTMR